MRVEALTTENTSPVGELGKFLRQAERGTFRGHAFLVEEQDRLSRQGIRTTLDIIGRFLDAGLELHITEKSLVIRREEDLDNLAIVVPTVVNGSSANEYTKKLSARVSSARASEREKARATGLAVTAKVPAWLKAEKGKKVVVIPEHGKTVARIFELAGIGLGAKRIVRKLEEEKRRPFGKNTEWSPEYVQKILRSRAVIGEYAPHRLIDGKRVPVGEPIPTFYPAVVTQSQFNAARASVEAKTRFRRKDGRPGFAGGRHDERSLFTPLVYDYDNKVKMPYNPRRKGDYDRLVSRWRVGHRQHSVRLEEFERLMLQILPDLDWREIAEESEAPEVKQAQAELDATLSEIDRRSARLASLEKLVAEGSFSRSLFETLDAEKLALGDLSARREKLAGTLTEACSRVAALHDREELIEAIHSGRNRELRSRLKTEIHKRIIRIDLLFSEYAAEGWDYLAVLRFVNGAGRIIGVRGDLGYVGAALTSELRDRDRFWELLAEVDAKPHEM
jgi:hypothetical protein